MQYRRELDGLRAIAVIPIVLLHAGFSAFGGGFVGVDVFFVLSGYLITSIIIAERQNNTFSLLKFYERRARRILPALLVTLLVSLPLAWMWLLPPDMSLFCQSILAVLGFVSNIFFADTTNYFGVAAPLTPLVHTWSLAVEEQFYIVFPAMLMLLWRFGRRPAGVIFAVIAVGSLVAAQYYAMTDTQFDFYHLPTRAWEILAGSVIAFYGPHLNPGEASSRVREGGSLLGLGLIVYAIFAFDDATLSPSLDILIPVVGAGLVIVFADETTLVGKLLGFRPLVAIGVISYSLYLLHQPILAFARHGLLAEPDTPTLTVLLLVMLGLSYASYRLIEQPFRRRSRFPRPVLLTIGGSAVLCLLAVAVSGWRTDGYAGRFDSTERTNQALVKVVRAERGRAVRGDVCQFNNFTKIGVEGFLNQWDCKDDSAFPHLQRIPVIITGDSHSADKVIALKLNGLLPLQIGGAGCSIVPKRMSFDCRRIYRKLYDAVAHDSYYQYLVLAQRFSDRDLTSESVRETVTYWKRYNKRLIWFSAMPTFYQWDAHLERDRPAQIDFRVSDLSERDEIRRIMNDAGIHVVDTRSLFCSLNHCGYLSSEGCVLLTDDSHLSLWGAQLFGHALLEKDAVFSQWAGVTGRQLVSPDRKMCHRPVV